jgi:hypothetical protein
MTRIEVSRAVVADPSSVALVLAGPAARELWPPRSDRIVGVVTPQQPGLAVTVDPPGRTSVGFAARVQVQSGDTTVAVGRLTILPADVDRGGCEVRISLDATDAAADRLRRDATRYLANVADLSRERSSAA